MVSDFTFYNLQTIVYLNGSVVDPELFIPDPATTF